MEYEGIQGLALKIELPHMEADIFPGSGSPSLVLVAGGRPPDPQWLVQFCKGRDIWAVDKGIEVCLNAKITPSLFIGDCDSASREGLLWVLNNKVHSVILPTEKNLTDLQATLRMAGESGIHSEVILTGAFGGRNDHFFANIFSMIWAEEEWGIQARCAADDRESVFLLKGQGSVEFSGVPVGTLVSTLSLSEKCEGVSLWGTKWPIEKGTLNIRRPFSVSNVVMKKGHFGSEVNERGSFGAELTSGWMCIYITAPGIEEKGWI